MASTRSIDSLINYETVKHFGNEAHEHRRYDECLSGGASFRVRIHLYIASLITRPHWKIA